MKKIPKELDELKQKIWDNLRGKVNPRTRKKYTESEAWAIATDRFNKSDKKLSTPEGIDLEEPSELLSNVIKDLERGEGQGNDGEKQGDGGADYCYCSCGYKVAHEKGVPCNEKKCPKCDTALTGVNPGGK